MRVSPIEHRVRGRVWLVAALLAGAGSMYGYSEVKERDEDRAKVLEASRAIGKVTVPYTGGGPVSLPPLTIETREPVAEPEARPEPPVEPPAPVAEPAPVAQSEPPPPQIIYVIMTQGESTPAAPPEEIAEEQAVATAPDGRVMYDPNVPYIYPTAVVRPVFPVALPSEPFVQGTAGSAPIGDNGAGGGTVSPGTTMGGGTPVGNAGNVPIGSVGGPPVGNAGGTAVGSAGAVSGPFVTPVAPGVVVPFGTFGFVDPGNPFLFVQ